MICESLVEVNTLKCRKYPNLKPVKNTMEIYESLKKSRSTSILENNYYCDTSVKKYKYFNFTQSLDKSQHSKRLFHEKMKVDIDRYTNKKYSITEKGLLSPRNFSKSQMHIPHYYKDKLRTEQVEGLVNNRMDTIKNINISPSHLQLKNNPHEKVFKVPQVNNLNDNLVQDFYIQNRNINKSHYVSQVTPTDRSMANQSIKNHSKSAIKYTSPQLQTPDLVNSNDKTAINESNDVIDVLETKNMKEKSYQMKPELTNFKQSISTHSLQLHKDLYSYNFSQLTLDEKNKENHKGHYVAQDKISIFTKKSNQINNTGIEYMLKKKYN